MRSPVQNGLSFGSTSLVSRSAASASVRASTIVGTPMTSAASARRRASGSASCVGTSTLPPMWPHFFTDASWSSKCTPAAPRPDHRLHQLEGVQRRRSPLRRPPRSARNNRASFWPSRPSNAGSGRRALDDALMRSTTFGTWTRIQRLVRVHRRSCCCRRRPASPTGRWP